MTEEFSDARPRRRLFGRRRPDEEVTEAPRQATPEPEANGAELPDPLPGVARRHASLMPRKCRFSSHFRQVCAAEQFCKEYNFS